MVNRRRGPRPVRGRDLPRLCRGWSLRPAHAKRLPPMTTRRDLLQSLPATGAAFAVAGKIMLDESPAVAQPVAQQPLAGHFHPLGKAPSRHTIAVLEETRRTLPFADTRDFEENRRGFIAPIP